MHEIDSLCTIVGDCIEIQTTALSPSAFDTCVTYRASAAWAREIVQAVLDELPAYQSWAEAERGHRRIVEAVRVAAARHTQYTRTQRKESAP
jgi:hypothetical protein